MTPRVAPAVLGSATFAVVDVETTGFSPRLGDRVIEVAVVRLSPDGTAREAFVSLVDPERDVGPTHVHGLRASDLVGAPTFREVVGDIAESLDGAILVAHNARFDVGFLRSEFERAGRELPPWPAICTLRLAVQLSPARRHRLGDCCQEAGIDLVGAHCALVDATATARLLSMFLRVGRARGLSSLESLGCEPATFPSVPWPPVPPSGKRWLRGESDVVRLGEPSFISRLVERLSPMDVHDADLAAYLDLVDRALEDRVVSEVEAEALFATAQEWGLEQDDALRANRLYLEALCRTALADRFLSEMERKDLETVCDLLGLSTEELDRALAEASMSEQAGRNAADLSGMRVCFTGTLTGRFMGGPITREQATRIAQEAGLEVRSG